MPRKTVDYYAPYDESSFHTSLQSVPTKTTSCVLLVYPGDLFIRRSSIYMDGPLAKIFCDDPIFVGYKAGDYVCTRGWQEKANNGCFKILVALPDELQLEATTLVSETTDFERELRRGEYLGFTTHDKTIEMLGLKFLADPGMNKTAIEITSSLENDNFEFSGFYSSNGFEREDVLEGIYDNAYMELFITDWGDTDIGRDIISKGHIGNFKLHDFGFTAEFHSILHRLTNRVGWMYQPKCRYQLADDRCAKDLGFYTETGTVTLVDSNRLFAVTIDTPVNNPSHIPMPQYEDYIDPATPDNPATGANWYDWWFKDGKLWFNTAVNVGNIGPVFGIKSYDKITWQPDPDQGIMLVVQLMRPTLYEINTGDTFTLTPGCNKTFADGCIQKFNNIYLEQNGNTFYRFGAEPFLPGNVAFRNYAVMQD